MAPRFKLPMGASGITDVIEAAYKCEVESRYRQYQADTETKRNIDSVARLLADGTGKFGLLFSGTCGNGKTTMMYAIRDVIREISRMGALDGQYAGKELIVKDAIDVVRTAADGDMQSIVAIPLLAIDDLGKEPAEVVNYGNIINPMVELIEKRYKRQLFTLATTNLTPRQIREKYGARMADRFNEMFNVVIFKSESYRKT